MAYRVGIIGATGAVGQEFLQLLHDRRFPASSLRLFASARSAGKTLSYKSHTYTVEETREEIFGELDLALFSAGADTSRRFGHLAAAHGCVVVDNSSAFRMDADVPLIVPEVNPDAARAHRGILANPNCSTAITLMGLYPLHRRFGLKRFFASTYQAVSGSGVEGMEELDNQIRAWAGGGESAPSTYPHPIAFNLIPHVDSFTPGGYTKEELKMLHESRKILGLPELAVSATCVRVPVMRAHSIAVNAEFERPVDLDEARLAIRNFVGAELNDTPAENGYPTPLQYAGKFPCGVGRLRLDSAFPNGLALWIVGDQLLKGAALNAVQIAELLHEQGTLRIS